MIPEKPKPERPEGIVIGPSKFEVIAVNTLFYGALFALALMLGVGIVTALMH